MRGRGPVCTTRSYKENACLRTQTRLTGIAPKDRAGWTRMASPCRERGPKTESQIAVRHTVRASTPEQCTTSPADPRPQLTESSIIRPRSLAVLPVWNPRGRHQVSYKLESQGSRGRTCMCHAWPACHRSGRRLAMGDARTHGRRPAACGLKCLGSTGVRVYEI